MPVQQIGGVFIRVKDLDRSVEFYTKHLGMEVAFREDWDGDRQANMRLGNQKMLLTIIENDDVQVIERPVFNLTSTDIKGMHKSLKDAGYEVTEIEEWLAGNINHVLFDVLDPDGHALNIIEMQKIENKVQ